MWKKALAWISGKQALAGVLLNPYMMYIKIGIVALLIGVIGAHLWSDHLRDKKLVAQAGSIEANVQLLAQATHTLRRNDITIRECLIANEWNARQAENQKVLVAKAVADIKILEALNERDKKDVIRETDNLRNKDTICRTADEPLPPWLLPDSLWDD